MEAVMFSFKPKEIEKIANGYQFILSSKRKPKCKTPFKCYIYCSKSRGHYYVAGCAVIHEDDLWKNDEGKIEFNDMWYYAGSGVLDKCFYLNGKVVGEFICDKVLPIEVLDTGAVRNYHYYNLEGTTLSIDEIAKRIGKNKVGYGLHISDLKIYDKPKELSEFQTPPCEKSEKSCEKCKYLAKIDTQDRYEVDCFVENGRPITRPPKSWFYVKEV